MAAEMVLEGIGVSGEIAIAPVFIVPERYIGERERKTPAEEKSDLESAIAAASTSLADLMDGLQGEEFDILEFQFVLLEDGELIAPAFEAIADGAAADIAWRKAMDAEIASYAADGDVDDAFSARGADLEDLRDRVLSRMFGPAAPPVDPEEPSILLAADLTPSTFLQMTADRIAGIALGAGSRTSHVALLARARGLPLVVGLGALPDRISGETAVLDAANGRLILEPCADVLAEAASRHRVKTEANTRYAKAAREVAVTRTGETVTVMINVDHPSILCDVDAAHCDGVGLTRTEFLFEQGAPEENAQVEAYLGILKWAAGRPVTIRTLDAGGDKPIPGLPTPEETNPFLGVRGVRFSLSATDVFSVQLRALLRSAVHGPLKIMVPMVTDRSELQVVRSLVRSVSRELEDSGVAFKVPPIGMMVEVPAAALAAQSFDADFYSIGTNDLIQYGTACARDNPDVASLARGDHPGVIRMIEAVVDAARERGVEVSVCGDMASDPKDVSILLQAGVRVLSVAPGYLGQVKAAVRAWPEDTGS